MKKPLLVRLSSWYLMVIGIFWALGILSPVLQRERSLNQMLYMKTAVTDVERRIREHTFRDDAAQQAARDKLTAVKKKMSHFETKLVYEVSIIHHIEGLLALLTGAFYFLAGLKIGQDSGRAKYFLVVGIAGFFLTFMTRVAGIGEGMKFLQEFLFLLRETVALVNPEDAAAFTVSMRSVIFTRAIAILGIIYLCFWVIMPLWIIRLRQSQVLLSEHTRDGVTKRQQNAA